MEQVSKLESLAAKATPGPYGIGHLNENEDRMDLIGYDGTQIADEVKEADLKFWMAANPKTVAELCRAVRVLQGALEDVQGECKWYWQYVEDRDGKHQNETVQDIQNCITKALREAGCGRGEE